MEILNDCDYKFKSELEFENQSKIRRNPNSNIFGTYL